MGPMTVLSADLGTHAGRCPTSIGGQRDMREDDRAAFGHTVVGGVDTHLDMNVAAVPGSTGALLGTAEFPATLGGHAQLLSWMRSFGDLAAVGVEGTGNYGAGLARFLLGSS